MNNQRSQEAVQMSKKNWLTFYQYVAPYSSSTLQNIFDVASGWQTTHQRDYTQGLRSIGSMGLQWGSKRHGWNGYMLWYKRQVFSVFC